MLTGKPLNQTLSFFISHLVKKYEFNNLWPLVLKKNTNF